MDVYLNGEMVPLERATVRVDDAGFQHAVGLFETMAAYHGRVFRLNDHIARLIDSAEQLGLRLDDPATRPDALAQAVRRAVEHNGLKRARVRLTVTPGPISLLSRKEPAPSSLRSSEAACGDGPTVLVVTEEPTIYDAAYFERGVMAVVVQAAANPFDPTAGHKTLAYCGRLSLLRRAASVGAGEAILLNITNHLASGAVSNLFLVKDGILLTPIARGEEAHAGEAAAKRGEKVLPAPVLPGITRKAIIELAQARDIEVRRRMLSISDLLEADEVFMTNSSWLILPVTRVEKKVIGPEEGGHGRIGPVTRQLRDDLLALIEQETV